MYFSNISVSPVLGLRQCQWLCPFLPISPVIVAVPSRGCVGRHTCGALNQPAAQCRQLADFRNRPQDQAETVRYGRPFQAKADEDKDTEPSGLPSDER